MAIVKFFMKLGLGFLALLFGLKSIFEAGEMSGVTRVAYNDKEEYPDTFVRMVRVCTDDEDK